MVLTNHGGILCKTDALGRTIDIAAYLPRINLSKGHVPNIAYSTYPWTTSGIQSGFLQTGFAIRRWR